MPLYNGGQKYCESKTVECGKFVVNNLFDDDGDGVFVVSVL